MIKYLIALMFSLSALADNYLILSGLAWHGRDKTDGTKYDVLIEGAGYQYRDGNWSGTLLAINDSNSNFMPSATIGWSGNVLWNINLGAEAGIGYRKYLRGRRITPILLPKMEVDFGWAMLNCTYIPKIETESIHIPQALYTNVGIKF